MKLLALIISILALTRASEDPLKPIFDVIDLINGFTSAIFDEAGCDKATDCLEDVKEIEIIIGEVIAIIKKMDPMAIVLEVVKIISDVAEIADDCKSMPSQFKILVGAFDKMVKTYQTNIKLALIKLMLAVIGEGTNLLPQINAIIAGYKAGHFFTVGNIAGRIVAMLTIKLY